MPSWIASLLVFLMLLAAEPAHASYVASDFSSLHGGADLIVVGEIVELTTETFTLRVEASLKGEAPSKTIEVRKFQDWTCAHRWCSCVKGARGSKPYAIGQREIAFLSKPGGTIPFHAVGRRYDQPDARDPYWGVLGVGNEGEWEIVGDRVVMQGRPIEGFDSVPSSEHRAQSVPLADALDVIREFSICFSATPSKSSSWEIDLIATCPADRFEELAARSLLHRRLLLDTYRRLDGGTTPATE